MGRLNAKIDLKSSEMAGNESKINKRNNNFDNCSLFLISIRHMIKKKPPRISETKAQGKRRILVEFNSSNLFILK